MAHANLPSLSLDPDSCDKAVMPRRYCLSACSIVAEIEPDAALSSGRPVVGVRGIGPKKPEHRDDEAGTQEYRDQRSDFEDCEKSALSSIAAPRRASSLRHSAFPARRHFSELLDPLQCRAPPDLAARREGCAACTAFAMNPAYSASVAMGGCGRAAIVRSTRTSRSRPVP